LDLLFAARSARRGAGAPSQPGNAADSYATFSEVPSHAAAGAGFRSAGGHHRYGEQSEHATCLTLLCSSQRAGSAPSADLVGVAAARCAGSLAFR